MNGVIVITTKKGSRVKLLFHIPAILATRLKTSYNDYNIMNSAQQMSVLGELERKGILNSECFRQS